MADMQTQSCSRVAVVGAGSWGTAVAGLVAPHAAHVMLWAHSPVMVDYFNATHHNPRYLPNYEVPANVVATSSLEQCVAGAEALFLVVPSAHVRSTCEALAPLVDDALPIAVLAKGIEAGSGLLMAQVAADVLGAPERIVALSGPNHAEEVSAGIPSGAVVAGLDERCTQLVHDLVSSDVFRVYQSDDLVGVEVCGAVKNVIALACGVAVGLGYGDNTCAMIMTRGLAEMGRIANAMGAQPITCMGLAGAGDLIATCTSPHSRNRSFGEAFARGTSLEEYERRTHMVVEGALAARSVLEVAGRLGVEVPITRAVHAILYEGQSLDGALRALTSRHASEEFYGMDA